MTSQQGISHRAGYPHVHFIEVVHTEHQAYSVTVDAPLLVNSIVAVLRGAGVEAEAGKRALSQEHNETKLAKI